MLIPLSVLTERKTPIYLLTYSSVSPSCTHLWRKVSLLSFLTSMSAPYCWQCFITSHWRRRTASGRVTSRWWIPVASRSSTNRFSTCHIFLRVGREGWGWGGIKIVPCQCKYLSEPVWPSGKVRICFVSPFSSRVVVCGHLSCDFVPHN